MCFRVDVLKLLNFKIIIINKNSFIITQISRYSNKVYLYICWPTVGNLPEKIKKSQNHTEKKL